MSAFIALISLHASGVVGSALYPVVTAGACWAGVVGLRRYGAEQRRPWWILISVGLLWTVAGVLRESTAATGDLSDSRSLLPDLFAIPGYVLFGVALVGLVRGETMQKNRSILIDALLIGIGSVAVVFSTVVEPTLEIPDSWLPARIVVAVYPAMSMWFLVVVVQIVLIRPHRPHGLALIVAGTACLQVGDVLFALGEVGRIDLSRNVLDVPYLAVAACIGSAALHPDVHLRVVSHTDDSIVFNPMRLFAVAVALIAPIAALAAGPATFTGRKVQLLLLTTTALLAMIRITVAARAENTARLELLRRATHDQLTGLPSRELLLSHATAHLSDPGRRPVALIFLDLDDFKLINDTLGHAAGDLLLMEVGQRLADVIREDDVVGRIGGDEFVIVANDLDGNGARALGDRIRRQFRAPFQVGHQEVYVSTSIGITIARPGASAAVMLQEADTAMYQSKRRGRNNVTLFHESMIDTLKRRVELEKGLRSALENGEVSVVFQPIVDVDRNAVGGFEALMRWTSNDTLYSPAEFIRIAEESGLIVSLGEFVLDEACRQLAHWRRTLPGGEDLTMSVNLSVRQVQASNIVDTVAHILETHRLPGKALWLEITESVMLEDTTTTIAVMTGLEALGVRFAIDDFGTGYSSLSYLRTFPMARIKVDRSFVADICSDTASAALVSAVVGIGQSMDLDIVAEGVETASQAQTLADLGCNQLQGYLYSRPVSAPEIPDVVETIALGPHARPGQSRAHRHNGRLRPCSRT